MLPQASCLTLNQSALSGKDDWVERNRTFKGQRKFFLRLLMCRIRFWMCFLSVSLEWFLPQVVLESETEQTERGGWYLTARAAGIPDCESKAYKALPNSPPFLVGKHCFRCCNSCRSLLVVSSNGIGCCSQFGIAVATWEFDQKEG